MEFYIHIFLYTLIVILIIFFKEFISNKKICILSFLLIYFISACRYDVGWDYSVYIADMINHNIYRYELLERILLEFCAETNLYQLFFFVNDFIILFPVFYTIFKRSVDPIISIIVFICFPFMWLMGLSTLRSNVVMALVFWGYEFLLKEKKYFKYLLLVSTCFFIHKSALFALAFLPFPCIRINRIGNVLILLVSLLALNISFNYGYILNFVVETIQLDQYYLQEDIGNIGGNTKVQYLFLLLNIFNVLNFKKLVKQSDTNIQYITFMNLGYLTYALLSTNTVLASRLCRFFYVFVILLLPYYMNCFDNFKKTTIKRFIYVCCIMLFVFQLSLHNYNGLDKWRISTYIPYKFFFLN